MTTFPNASNPKKKMTKIIAVDARDKNLNRKRKYEEKNTESARNRNNDYLFS